MERLQNKFFTAEKRNDHMWQITGLTQERCYLVEGNQRALLIDGLTGVGSLRAFVRELTELPVIMAATHGHLDHIGAAFEYGEVRIHPADIAMIYGDTLGGDEARFQFATTLPRLGVRLRTEVRRDDVIPTCPIKTLPIWDGDRIDLGGKVIDVVGLPGHSGGTVIFLDRTSRIAYGGDACNLNTLLNLEGSETIETYCQALHRFKRFTQDFDCMYCGHDQNAVPPAIIDDAINLCEHILNGTDDAIPVDDSFGGPSLLASERINGYEPKCGGLCNIVYKRERIQ